jgi:hypothetical protein
MVLTMLLICSADYHAAQGLQDCAYFHARMGAETP